MRPGNWPAALGDWLTAQDRNSSTMTATTNYAPQGVLKKSTPMLFQPSRKIVCRLAVVAAFSCGSAGAETVMVKYRGPVDLAAFDCLKQPSSLVWRTCYLLGSQYMVVNLKGTYYHYCRMSGSVVADWRTADSLGRFYLANVRGRFDCRLGGIPPG
jgi:hypothetical protein